MGALQLENARLREELDRLKRRVTRSASAVLGAAAGAAGAAAAATVAPDVALLAEVAKVGLLGARPAQWTPFHAGCGTASVLLRVAQ
jgi:hypothetical protein